MNYIKLMNVVKELGYLRFNSDSPEFLKIFLDKGMYEYYSAFDVSAWSVDNLILLFSQFSDPNYFLFLKKYNFQNHDKSFVERIVKELIDRNFYDLIIDLFGNFLKKDRELCNLFLFNVKDMNLSSSKLISFFCDNEYRIEIMNKLIEEDRIELLAFLLTSNLSFNEKEMAIILENCVRIAEYLVFFNINVSNKLFRDNVKLFEALFMNGYFMALKCISYYGYDDVENFISTNERVLDKVVEYAKTEDKEYLKLVFEIPIMKKRKDLLKILLERKCYNELPRFSLEAWTLDNQITYYKLQCESDEPILGVRDRRDIERNCPYLLYKSDYIFSKPYIRDVKYNNINDNNSFNSFDVAISIGRDVSENTIDCSDYVNRFYKFIFETKSKNIHRLIIALTGGNISKLDKIFDDQGFTDYFKEFILFDVDYICFKGVSILSEYHSLEYATYVNILNLSNDMKKYFYCLNINIDNLSLYFTDKTITRKAIDILIKDGNGILALVELISLNYELNLTGLERKLIDKYTKIESVKQKELFIDFCLKHKDDLKEESIDRAFVLISKVVNSNSYEIRKQADGIVLKLINKDDCIEKFYELENIFIDGASPEFIKRFAIYKILYGDVDISKDSNVKSPILKSVSREEADKIILDDLLRISLATNSLNIKRYLQILSEGFKVYCTVDKNNEVSDKDMRMLHEYRIRIEFIVKYFMDLDYISVDDDYQTIFNIERACLRKSGINIIPDNFHLVWFNDLILADISCSFKSMVLLQSYMAKHSISKTLFEEVKHMRDEKLTIKEGDFLKGINSEFLDNIFSYGSLSIEFLGEDASQDFTHLDTDMSLIDKDVSSIPELLSMSLPARNYGDMYLLLSREYIDHFDETILTVDKDGEKEFTEEDKNKTELLCNNASSNHYCIRTGFPITYVKAIIASRNFDRARFIALKNDFFVPIYDTKGELIFSFEDYCRERKAMDGLTYYGRKNYTVSDSIYNNNIDEVAKDLNDSLFDATYKKTAIYSVIMPIFNKYFSDVKDYIGSSVRNGVAEIVDTGSTGRGTNVYGDGDFDFIVRLDKEFIESPKFKEVSNEIYRAFGKSAGNERIIRLDDVKIEGVDVPLKIEITFIDKNSKVEYSTDMCIKDRLATIKSLHSDKYSLIIANILFAKRFFKELGIYKRFEGGLGGVGVENFVLQHNGSFYDAASRFVAVAEECGMNLEEFKRKFHIYDFGKNHYSYASVNRRVDFPYDNFVNNINSTSFPKLVSALKDYLGYEKENKNMQF